MSNAQDLLSILGGAGAGANRPSRAAGATGGATTSGGTETSILHFKAGKMNTTLKPNGKYLVEPDARRGELHVVWTVAPAAAGSAAAAARGATGGGRLQMEWKDRRTKTTVNTIAIFPEDDATFERVETGREGDRVYLLQCGNNQADSRHFFWMQDKDIEPDEDLCVKVNLYMSDYASAAEAAGTSTAAAGAAAGTSAAGTGGGMDNDELLRIMQGALGGAGGGATEAEAAPAAPEDGSGGPQADALGNILENLGLPPPNSGATPAAGTAAATGAAAAGAGAGGLTLADLQGAMAGLATASPPAGASGPPLSELASTAIVEESGILSDPSTVARLVALLPEGQRTESQLRENVHSPQVAQCLQRLTAALAEEGAEGFNSIIANFQLNPSDGAQSGNPIEAFLQCLLKDVERKEGLKKIEKDGKEDVSGEEGGKKDDEGKGGGKNGGDDADVKMDES